MNVPVRTTGRGAQRLVMTRGLPREVVIDDVLMPGKVPAKWRCVDYP
jgi:hypothetical protein